LTRFSKFFAKLSSSPSFSMTEGTHTSPILCSPTIAITIEGPLGQSSC
jgi:hypothetical protein